MLGARFLTVLPSSIANLCVLTALLYLELISGACKRYLALCLPKARGQRMIFEDGAPRVGKIRNFYASVWRNSFLDTFKSRNGGNFSRALGVEFNC